jgi:peptidoglycan hydrolase-like protein with peptidoglycan-binding domain/lysophospholipase L1-like esterase
MSPRKIFTFLIYSVFGLIILGSASTANAYTFKTPLSLGSKGSDVSALQQILKDKGYYTYPAITGLYGPLTQKAVQEFQKANNIASPSGNAKVTGYGRVGPKTISILNQTSSQNSGGTGVQGANTAPLSSVMSLDFKKDLKLGANDSDVRLLQQFLNARGYIVAQSGVGSFGKETTYFGPATLQALNKFKTAHNLNGKDENLGSETRKFINSVIVATRMSLTASGNQGGAVYLNSLPRSSNTGDVTGPQISSVVAEASSTSSETISWITDELSTTQVEYGTTTAYGFSTSTTGALSTYHAVYLSGLTSSTTYHYRVTSVDASSNQSVSSDYVFITATSSTVTTAEATSVATTTAVLNGQIVSDGFASSTARGFIWGTTTAYGATTTETGAFGNGAFSASISGLTTNTAYHFKAYATNLASTTYGIDRMFVTTGILPNGTIGLWYIDQYSSSTRPMIANAVSVATTSPNLMSAPRKLFANTEWWIQGGSTVTDAAATAPDGTLSASTINGTGNWIIHPALANTMPAGTYTLAVSAKRNTGTDQQFAFYRSNTGVRSSAQTATASWQRFTYTFTLGSPAGINLIGLGSIDGSTAGNIQFTDFELYSGSSDLGPSTYGGHLYLGSSAYDTRPVYTSGTLDLSSNGYGLIQYPSNQTFSAVTLQALVSKVASGSGYHSILSKVQSYTDLSLMTEQSTAPAGYFNGGNAVGPAQSSGLWVASGKGYHVVTLRYDGAKYDYWIDDIRMLTNATVRSSVTASDLFLNLTNSTALYGGNKFAGSIALWNRGLTDAEITNSVLLQKAQAASSSVTVTNASRVLVAEGDSITGGSSFSYPYLYGPNASPALYGVNYAVSGSGISDLNARASNVDGVLPYDRTGRKFILSVNIGANDLSTGYSGAGGTGISGWLADLATYLDARRAAGWKVALCTVLPRTAVGFNTARATANTTLRTWVGTHADAICDFAADATMGADATASNVTYFSDGTHPTATGQAILETVYRATINAI